MLYTVHVGQEVSTTEDPELALERAKSCTAYAFITVPSEKTCRPKIVWSSGLPSKACRL